MTPEITAKLVADRLTGSSAAPKTNGYKNVDAAGLAAQPGFVRVCGDYITHRNACDALGIPFARYLCGFAGKRKYGFRPQFDGIVVRADYAELLREYLHPYAPSERRNRLGIAEMEARQPGCSLDPEEDARCYA